MSSSFDPYPGGVEEHTRQIAVQLVRLGLPVEVWTVDRGEHLGVRHVDDVVVRYLPTPLPSASPRGVVAFARAAPAAWRAWRTAHDAFAPDVLHVQCFGPNGVYALALSQRYRLPLVVSSHGETTADDHGAFDTSAVLRAALRASLSRAAAVTAPSQPVLDDLSARFGLDGGGVVVPNGVDPAFGGRRTARRAASGGAPPTILAVGRVERVKGFDLLLRSLPLVEPSSARVLIIGDGGELPALRTLADDLGVADRVTFAGAIPRAEVIATLPEADVVAVPSRTESFGIVVLEAWQGGVPLVATVNGGPGELVTDGVDGLVADPEDPAAFAGALTRVLGSAELRRRLVAGGRRTVRRYTWGAAARAYCTLYARALGSR